MLEIISHNIPIYALSPTGSRENNVIMQGKRAYYKTKGSVSSAPINFLASPRELRKVNHFNIFYKNNRASKSKAHEYPFRPSEMPELLTKNVVVDLGKIRCHPLKNKGEPEPEKTEKSRTKSPKYRKTKGDLKFSNEDLDLMDSARTETPFSKVSYLKSETPMPKQPIFIIDHESPSKGHKRFVTEVYLPPILKKSTSHLFIRNKFQTKYQIDPKLKEHSDRQEFNNLKYQRTLIVKPSGYTPYPMFDL
jgi:hypothetical protein